MWDRVSRVMWATLAMPEPAMVKRPDMLRKLKRGEFVVRGVASQRGLLSLQNERRV